MEDKRIIQELKDMKYFIGIQIRQNEELISEIKGLRRIIESGNIKRN